MTRPLATRARASARRTPRPPNSASPSPLVLTARPLLRARPDLAPALAAAHLDLHLVASWERLLEPFEQAHAGVILLDIDAADESGKLRHTLSGHRIASLLARQRGPHTALVVLTHMDFAEVEDLVRAGISQLLSPQIPTKTLAVYLRTAAMRTHPRAAAPRRAVPAPATATASAPSTAPLDDALWRTIGAVFAGQPATRSRISNARILAAALYLLRSSSPWSALPPEFAAARTVRKRLLQWHDTGTLDGLRAVLAASGITFPVADWERLVSSPGARRPVAVVS